MADSTGAEVVPLTYSFEQMERVLGLSEKSVRALMNRADHPLPVARLGGRLIFPRRAVEQWLLEESTPMVMAETVLGRALVGRPAIERAS